MYGLIKRLMDSERRAGSLALVAILGWLLGSAACAWQVTGGDDAIRQAIDRGEFSRAVALVDPLPAERADGWRQQLVMAQWSHGAPEAAWHSLRSIVSSDRRDEVLQSWANDRQPNTGHRGGITEADFQELIRLIQRSIDPDSWQENGGDGTMEPFANGVYVDQSGTLHRARRDTTGRLDSIRRRVAQQTPPSSDQEEESPSRCVSLVRLERECQIHAVRGDAIPEMLTNLAGLYRIDYLVVDREANDLILVGPAGPWSRDKDGRVVNTATGLPVLQLDDLVVCLRNARFAGGKFGCSIEPRPDRLAETQRFVETTRARGEALREQLAQHLGMQDVVVFGLPA
ncbi:MAG TPA: DUF1598 domain-containing protein, partial [Pirellulaceae bacterium]|nr:DUF1598 domain-containing protein [Pirellulaceae bacterium]